MNEFGVTLDNLRGTNYLFNSGAMVQADFALLSHQSDAGPRNGTYDFTNIDSELAMLARSGFNNLRIWPPFFGWIIDKAQYRAHLREFLAACRRHRLTLTWALWNAVGNGVLWQTHDLASLIGGAVGDTTNDGLYDTLTRLTELFQSQNSRWVPAGKPGYSTGYPAPGNGLLRQSGDPRSWRDASYIQRVEEYLRDVLEILKSADGQATLFEIDVANEFDGVGIPLGNTLDFVAWNLDIIRQELPNAPVTVGWAEHRAVPYSGYFAEMQQRGIALSCHSFHIYVDEPHQYVERILPLLEWADPHPIRLKATEFYRTDTAEWGRLDTGLEFFAEHRVPTIMWGFINSNLYDDPNKTGSQNNQYLDGVVEATELGYGREYEFSVRKRPDYEAVLRYNGVAP
ncbi:MAG: hypothetical protein H6836_06050 [Planctomycetes bacterium]|nr:hypothetical protein [Planctomycetota bacterium]